MQFKRLADGVVFDFVSFSLCQNGNLIKINLVDSDGFSVSYLASDFFQISPDLKIQTSFHLVDDREPTTGSQIIQQLLGRMSVDAIAAACDVHRATVYRWRNGEMQPTPQNAWVLKNLLAGSND